MCPAMATFRAGGGPPPQGCQRTSAKRWRCAKPSAAPTSRNATRRGRGISQNTCKCSSGRKGCCTFWPASSHANPRYTGECWRSCHRGWAVWEGDEEGWAAVEQRLGGESNFCCPTRACAAAVKIKHHHDHNIPCLHNSFAPKICHAWPAALTPAVSHRRGCAQVAISVDGSAKTYASIDQIAKPTAESLEQLIKPPPAEEAENRDVRSSLAPPSPPSPSSPPSPPPSPLLSSPLLSLSPSPCPLCV